MIVGMLNLVCADGHRHYSPRPMRWVGKACYTPLGVNAKCQEPLKRMRKKNGAGR